MTEQSRDDMKNACHLTAEWVLRSPSVSNRGKWLRKEIARFLSKSETIDHFAEKYAREYRYADVPTAFLADILKTFDEETN